MTAVLIVAIVALILITIIMAVVIYNQMLLLNQVNKRLLLLAKESIESERYSIEEIEEKLNEMEAEFPNANPSKETIDEALGKDEDTFDPHTFDPRNLE